jgi:hypothetical protein
MPDGTQGNNPVTTQGTTTFGQTGTGTPPNPAAVNQGLSDTLANLGKQVEILSKIAEEGRLISTDLTEWQTKLKSIIQYTEDYEDSFTRLVALSRQFGDSGIFKAKNYRELKAHLEELVDTQKQLLQKGFFDKQEQKAIQGMIDHTSRGVKNLETNMASMGRTMEDSIDPNLIDQLSKNLRTASKEVDNMRKLFNNVHIKPLTKEMLQMNEAMGRSGLLEKYAKYGEVASRIDRLRMARKDEGRAGLQQKMEMMKAHTIASARRAGLMGGTRDVRIKQFKPAYFKGMARELAEGAGGGGLLDRYLGQRALKQMVETPAGAKPTFLARAMEMGQGSVIKGVGGLAAGGEAGMMSNVMGGVAQLAPMFAIGELLEKFIDANAKANRDIAEQLGEAGIFGGAGSGATNLFSVRKALGSENWGFNLTGETFKRNLKIAEAIKEGGVNLPELATGVRPGEATGIGMVKNIAYHGAKLAGFLDEGAATKEIMKVLQQYHESFTGVQDFFQHINRDTIRAGITTTKYIGIIDELNKQFDRMGQSLEQTTNIMRVLGRTGVQSSEDVREALSALTNAGQKRSFEIQTFLGMRAAQQGRGGEQVELQQQNVGIAKQRAQEAFSAIQGLDLGTINNREDIAAARAHLARTQNGTPVERQAALGALNQLDQEMARLDAAKRVQSLAGQGRFGEAGLAYAAGQATLGRNLTQSTFEQFQFIRDSLKLAGAGTVGQLATGKVDLTNPALVKITELLQSDPMVFQKLQRVFQAQAQATTGMAATGALKDDKTYSRLVTLAAGIQGAPEAMRGAQTDRARIQKLFKEQPKLFDKLTARLAGSEDILEDILKTETGADEVARDQLSIQDRQDQDRKAEDVATATRPLAEIFADAFDNLFNTISAPLGAIYDFLSQRFGNRISGTETERVRQEYQGDAFDKLTQHIDELKDESKNRLRDIQRQLDDNPTMKDTDPAQYNKLQMEKTQEINRQTGLGYTMNELVETQRRATSVQGITTKEEVINADSILANAPVLAKAADMAFVNMAKAAETQGDASDAIKNFSMSGEDLLASAKQFPGSTTITNVNTTNIGAHISSQAIPPAATNQAPGEGRPAITTLDGRTVTSSVGQER